MIDLPCMKTMMFNNDKHVENHPTKGSEREGEGQVCVISMWVKIAPPQRKEREKGGERGERVKCTTS